MFIFVLYTFLVGVCLGSFSYAFALRFQDGRDWVKGRSECESCGHILAAKDLVPVISWCLLRGKCRYCKAVVGYEYVAVECLSGLVAVATYVWWPYALSPTYTVIVATLGFILLPILCAMVLMDLRWFLLSDKLTLSAAVLGAGIWATKVLAVPFTLSSITDLIAALVITAGIFWVIYQASNGRAIGGGDVKFGVCAGFILGTPFKAALYIFVASTLGSIVSMYFIAKKSKNFKAHVPFGPFLIIALWAVFIGGDALVDKLTTQYLF